MTIASRNNTKAMTSTAAIENTSDALGGRGGGAVAHWIVIIYSGNNVSY